MSTRRQIAAGVAIYACFALRTVGGILLPVLVVYALLRLRRIPRGVWIVLVTAGLLIGMHSVVTLRENLSYTDGVAIPQAVVSGYLSVLRELYFPLWGGRLPSVLLCAMLGVLCIWGYVSRLRSALTILEVFAAFYLVLLIVLPWGDARYLIPLIPLWLMYTFVPSGPCREAESGVPAPSLRWWSQGVLPDPVSRATP